MDLSQSRILVSNDDGIHAPGLKVLEKIARSLSNDVWVVAPETEQSAAGHSLTLTLPLRESCCANALCDSSSRTIALSLGMPSELVACESEEKYMRPAIEAQPRCVVAFESDSS